MENQFSQEDIFTPKRTELKGERIGDRSIRFRKVRIKGIKKVEQGAYEITSGLKPSGFWEKLTGTLYGKPIRSEHEINERLTKIKGVAVFASDNISSSAYATEEIMRILILGGAGALILNLPITITVVILLAIVTISYQQTIKAYPSGGGSYIVAKDNLGDAAGLIAASALLIDYILTVAVSVSAGIYAVVSAFPVLYSSRVALCLIAIAVIALANLRGIKESGTIFALPVYIYIFSMFGVLLFGIMKYFTGTLPMHGEIISSAQSVSVAKSLGFFLILRAFASGACGLTGVEAVANGVPAFKPPEARNARITQIWTGILFGSMFLLISFLATKMGIMPDPHEAESVVSKIIKIIAGTGWAYYLVQFSTMFILILAANTSFADFPRLSYFMAKDKFLPSHFSFRGDRLAFNNGIFLLTLIACALVVVFSASVTNLIPLYTIGVFISFTLSQGGMVVHWWRNREPGWKISLLINAFGALVTTVVFFVVGITKFSHGAWMVLLLIPLMVYAFLSVRGHYHKISSAIKVDAALAREYMEKADASSLNYILIPVADMTLPALNAVAYAQSFAGKDPRHVIINAVHVTDDLEEGHKLQQRWLEVNAGVPLVIIQSPYRRLIRPILNYIDAIDFKYKDKEVIITVLVPEVVSRKWWEFLYHTNTALLLKTALLFKPRTVAVSFPYHIH